MSLRNGVAVTGPRVLRRRTSAIVTAAALAVVALLAYGAYSYLNAAFSLLLGQAARAFHLRVPPGAVDVKYEAGTDFQGKADLLLRFTTSAAGLRSFLATDGLEVPSRHPGSVDVTTFGFEFSGSSCGSPPGPGPHLAYAQDPSGEEEMLIDLADPAHPVVWFRGQEI